jgi:hypothetical protein
LLRIFPVEHHTPNARLFLSGSNFLPPVLISLVPIIVSSAKLPAG